MEILLYVSIAVVVLSAIGIIALIGVAYLCVNPPEQQVSALAAATRRRDQYQPKEEVVLQISRGEERAIHATRFKSNTVSPMTERRLPHEVTAAPKVTLTPVIPSIPVPTTTATINTATAISHHPSTTPQLPPHHGFKSNSASIRSPAVSTLDSRSIPLDALGRSGSAKSIPSGWFTKSEDELSFSDIIKQDREIPNSPRHG